MKIQLHSRAGMTPERRFRSHQWAVIPEALAAPFLTGGLKNVRRLIEDYFRYRFSPQGRRWVRAAWHQGQPLLMVRGLRVPLVQLGRLRQTGTVDVYRGFMEVLGGGMVDAAAVAAHRPWPDDLPWVAPSAGEFDIDSESHRPPYLGIFEMRVARDGHGCVLHVALRDFPPVQAGFKRWLWLREWQPLTAKPNLEFLQTIVAQIAHQQELVVAFECREHEGVPDALPALHTELQLPAPHS